MPHEPGNVSKRHFTPSDMLAVVAVAFATVSVILSGWTAQRSRAPMSAAEIGQLTVRRISIVDDQGVARVQIGAPVPDPIGPAGETGKRNSPAYGITIHDANGAERGGFTVNDDDVAAIGLDGVDGAERAHLVVWPHGQTMLLLREPGGLRTYVGVDKNGSGVILFDGDGVQQGQFRFDRTRGLLVSASESEAQ